MTPQRADEPKLELRLLNAMASVEECRLAVFDYLEPFGIGSPVMNRVEVVLEELISNIVRHSHGAGEVRIIAGFSGRSIDLVVEDDGPQFNPFEVPEPDPFTSLNDARLGGLGIPLVRKLSASSRYDRVKNRNRVSVTIANA